MTVPFASRVKAAENVLIRELEGESVLLNLDSESYFGLDDVGSRMWSVLTSSESIQACCDILAREYDVSDQQLREDLATLIEKLVAHDLVKIEAN